MGASDRKREKRQETTDQRARVESIQVVDETGQDRNEFETGETVKVNIQLSCREPVKNARLVVALCSPVHGTLASVSTPYQNLTFDLDENGRLISLTFPSIPLLIGAYHFNVSLLGPETTDFYHRASGRGVFRIVGPPTDANGFGINGVTSLQHDWGMNG